MKEICLCLAELQKKYREKKKISAALNYIFIDKKQINLLKKAGITKIEIGLQTINPQAYRNLDRFPLNLKKFKKIIKMFDENFELTIDIILGLPGDNLKGFLKTIDFIASQCKTRAKVKINCEELKILPKSGFAQKSNIFNINYKKTVPYLEISNYSFSAEEILKAKNIANLL